MRMSEKRCNKKHNSDNPLTSRRTDGGKKKRTLGLLKQETKLDARTTTRRSLIGLSSF